MLTGGKDIQHTSAQKYLVNGIFFPEISFGICPSAIAHHRYTWSVPRKNTHKYQGITRKSSIPSQRIEPEFHNEPKAKQTYRYEVF